MMMIYCFKAIGCHFFAGFLIGSSFTTFSLLSIRMMVPFSVNDGPKRYFKAYDVFSHVSNSHVFSFNYRCDFFHTGTTREMFSLFLIRMMVPFSVNDGPKRYFKAYDVFSHVSNSHVFSFNYRCDFFHTGTTREMFSLFSIRMMVPFSVNDGPKRYFKAYDVFSHVSNSHVFSFNYRCNFFHTGTTREIFCLRWCNSIFFVVTGFIF